MKKYDSIRWWTPKFLPRPRFYMKTPATKLVLLWRTKGLYFSYLYHSIIILIALVKGLIKQNKEK